MREGGLGLHHIFSGEHTPTRNRLSRDAWGSQVVSHTAFHREFFPSPKRDGGAPVAGISHSFLASLFPLWCPMRLYALQGRGLCFPCAEHSAWHSAGTR